MPIMFGLDHMYVKRCDTLSFTPAHTPPQSPKTLRRKRRSSPTGSTPHQPSKIGQKQNILWTEAEKEFVKQYVEHNPQGRETLREYWETCSKAMNKQFTSLTRNGISCKAQARRLLVTPPTRHPTSNSSMVSLDAMDIAEGFQILSADVKTRTTRDVETQTTLSLPVKSERGDVKDDDWVFMEPTKELKPDSSIGAQCLHQSALKRLRRYPCISDAEKASLIDVLTPDCPSMNQH
ncbi:hypothetical protein DPMN_140497 [Dreissena polymorpha]|uniref:Uncharacterized protein n=1 Tax=Dreissena polymorpha TaxID=45954 RepID=A0A9D4JGR0_DREPO|nr:hypothetical protein DPMN_140497 [Dreissena polymorpha]